MGYDLERFVTHVDDEFICTICTMVLENGIQLQQCEHMFCDQCIKNWISVNSICPVDRKPITLNQVKPISRAFNNLLLKLEIKCSFEHHGCRTTVKLESLQNHIDFCTFNPNMEKTCDKGCGLTITAKEYKTHNCIKLLAQLLLDQQKEIMKSKDEIRALIRTKKWKNSKNTINEENEIYYPITRVSELKIYNSHSSYPITEVNNYFQVKILDLGSHKSIAVGLTCKVYSSDRLPGWDKGSIAYHGDDGKIFIESGHGQPFGSIWENGDVIGCGIKFTNNFNILSREPVVVYFMRNNILLGERSIRIPDGGFFPSIGLKSIGARVLVNYFNT